MKDRILTVFRWLQKKPFKESCLMPIQKPVLMTTFWILVPYLTIITLLIIMAVRMYQCNKRRYNLNRNLEEYIKTVKELERAVGQLSDTMNEVSANSGLEGQQRDKVRLAIWRINTMQNTLHTLAALEKDSELTANLKEMEAANEATYPGKHQGGVTMLEEPHLPVMDSSFGSDQYFLEKVFSIIRECYMDPSFSVDNLSQNMGMSRSSFYNKIKAISGQAPADFIRQYRMERAKELLKSKQYSIAEVAFKAGFSDVKYFREVFRKKYNRSPSQYAKSAN